MLCSTEQQLVGMKGLPYEGSDWHKAAPVAGQGPPSWRHAGASCRWLGPAQAPLQRCASC